MRAPIKRMAVYNQLKGDIARNIFPAGSCLPNEIKLAERYSVGRKTMRGALAMLEDENRITRDRRRGTMVCDIKHRSKTGMLGIVGINEENRNDAMLIDKIDTLASKYGYHVINIKCNKRILVEHPEYLPSFPVDGFVFVGSKIVQPLVEVIRERALPVVGTSQVNGFAELDWMENPHYEAFSESLRYLKSLGHRRIAYIDFKKPPEYQCSHNILKSAFADVLKEDYAEELFYAQDYMYDIYAQYGEHYHYEKCCRALKYLMALDAPPTAIITSATTGHGIEDALNDIGFSVPRDISFLLFSECKGLPPKYTAIEYNREQRLRWATKRLIDIIEKGKKDIKHEYCRYKLTIGDTTAIAPQLNLS